MATQLYKVTGIDHLSWKYIAFGEDERDVVLRFVGVSRSTFPKAIDIARLRMRDWHFTECVYNCCDEVRVLDQGDDAQLEFGRFTVQFLRSGEIVGEHSADSVAVRPAEGSPNGDAAT